MHVQNVKETGRSWFVCFFGALFFFYEFFQMNMLNSLSQSLMADFGFQATMLGKIASMYSIANVLFLFVAGAILDRFSTRKVIITAMIFCITGTFAFAMSTQIWQLMLFRFFTGIGGAFCLISCVRLASRWFPSSRLALVTGLIITMAMIGASTAQTPLTLLVHALGWRHAILVDGFVGILVLFGIMAFVSDGPEHLKEYHDDQRQELKEMGILKSLRLAYGVKQNWLAGLYTCCLNLPLVLLGALYGTLFLTQAHGFTDDQAATASMMVFVGTIIGSPLMGFISDKMKRRKTPMLIGAILALGLILFIMYSSNLSFTLTTGLFFLLGLITSTQVISYPFVAESNSPSITATAVSTISITTLSGYYVFQPLFGKMLDWNWEHQFVNNVPLYSARDFQTALLIIPIAFVVAMIAVFFMKETYCQAVTKSK